MAEVKIPEVGESITEGILLEWIAADGALVKMNDPLFVLETDKITMDVVSEVAGTLSIQVAAGETVTIGQTVGLIDTEAAGDTAAAPAPAETAPAIAAATPEPVTAGVTGDQAPSVRRLVTEHGLDPSAISGSGKGGRLTKEDILSHLDGKSPSAPVTVAPAAQSVAAAPAVPLDSPTPTPAPAAPPRPADPVLSADGRETRQPMTSLRKRVAERLLLAQQGAAILTTFNELDMSAVLALRTEQQEAFQQKFGIKLGFMSFFIKGAVEALKTVPAINARIEGEMIVHNHYFDIGVAVGTDRGLVVPVIRNADQLSYDGVEKTIADLAGRARDRKLTLNDLSGGVFSISNGGIYGNMMSTPIINPPQSGILGMHAIKKRAVVVDDEIVVRPMMYVALSYDHRLVDGKEAVTFLKTIVDYVENPDPSLLGL
jgi:2-oxoglutarate dehydrogenase E2 component (dihydrolipoamide succinyltransferase)